MTAPSEAVVRIACVVYGAMSVLTATIYFIDKRLAVRGARRIPERSLHTLELLGGWPGALMAQQIFRHKRSKPSFYLVSWLVAVLHAVAWTLVLQK